MKILKNILNTYCRKFQGYTFKHPQENLIPRFLFYKVLGVYCDISTFPFQYDPFFNEKNEISKNEKRETKKTNTTKFLDRKTVSLFALPYKNWVEEFLKNKKKSTMMRYKLKRPKIYLLFSALGIDIKSKRRRPVP